MADPEFDIEDDAAEAQDAADVAEGPAPAAVDWDALGEEAGTLDPEEVERLEELADLGEANHAVPDDDDDDNPYQDSDEALPDDDEEAVIGRDPSGGHPFFNGE